MATATPTKTNISTQNVASNNNNQPNLGWWDKIRQLGGLPTAQQQKENDQKVREQSSQYLNEFLTKGFVTPKRQSPNIPTASGNASPNLESSEVEPKKRNDEAFSKFQQDLNENLNKPEVQNKFIEKPKGISGHKDTLQERQLKANQKNYPNATVENVASTVAKPLVKGAKTVGSAVKSAGQYAYNNPLKTAALAGTIALASTTQGREFSKDTFNKIKGLSEQAPDVAMKGLNALAENVKDRFEKDPIGVVSDALGVAYATKNYIGDVREAYRQGTQNEKNIDQRAKAISMKYGVQNMSKDIADDIRSQPNYKSRSQFVKDQMWNGLLKFASDVKFGNDIGNMAKNIKSLVTPKPKPLDAQWQTKFDPTGNVKRLDELKKDANNNPTYSELGEKQRQGEMTAQQVKEVLDSGKYKPTGSTFIDWVLSFAFPNDEAIDQPSEYEKEVDEMHRRRREGIKEGKYKYINAPKEANLVEEVGRKRKREGA